MRSSLTLLVGFLLVLVAVLLFALRGRDAETDATDALPAVAARDATTHPLSAEPVAASGVRSPVVPEPVAPPPSPVVERIEPVAPPRIVATAPSAPSDFAEPVAEVEQDQEQLEKFLETKYSGWSLAQKQAGIAKLQEACRAIEAIPGEVKTRSQDYQMLVSELNWLKEHQDP